LTASQRRRSGSRDLCRVGMAERAEGKRRRRVRSIKRSGLWVGFYLEPSAGDRKNRFGTTTTYRPNVFSALTKPLGHCAQHNTILSGALRARCSSRRKKKSKEHIVKYPLLYYVSLSLSLFLSLHGSTSSRPSQKRRACLHWQHGMDLLYVFCTVLRNVRVTYTCVCVNVCFRLASH